LVGGLLPRPIDGGDGVGFFAAAKAQPGAIRVRCAVRTDDAPLVSVRSSF
jgi:hypothetical protein